MIPTGYGQYLRTFALRSHPRGHRDDLSALNHDNDKLDQELRRRQAAWNAYNEARRREQVGPDGA